MKLYSRNNFLNETIDDLFKDKSKKENNKVLYLIVEDSSDPSVGMFSTSWEVECPFNSDADKESREAFKKDITKAYQEYSEGRISSYYSDEPQY